MVDITCINEEDIGGIKLTCSVKLNPNDDRSYSDIGIELHEKLIDMIEELGHNCTIASSKPISKYELE